MAARATKSEPVVVKRVNMRQAEFHLTGIAPLVIHRFAEKTKREMLEKSIAGKTASSRKTREPRDIQTDFINARYIARQGWDGINASTFRNALISACKLVNFKMTLAKLSLFVMADGWDNLEPQIPLVRIENTEAVLQQDMARTTTKQPYVTVRAAYHGWKARVRIRFDADQFTLEDVTNLLMRVGLQVGINEGRPDSKNSAGMGWGLFIIDGADYEGFDGMMEGELADQDQGLREIAG